MNKTTVANLRADLYSIAEKIICDVTMNAEESGKHTPGSWTKEGMEHHLSRVVQHIADYMSGDRSEEHLEHALCRMSMAVWSRSHNLIGDYGNEGQGR